ncbi:TolC family protein [candidate division NPL-UPA2 bacterium Unc8]|uniref:TolC family protein n=1 Tax=candidate division NPL-UPA2 bacterium Unc8 TaxID=1980939 RepID=A0A399FZ47_UNCN2|nr:Outer membrane efflux protein BepC [Bacillota bacterium]MBT9147403.1 Outer membrane efflux protein BepC [Bacillota bacterium]RII00532.1 MAG: TolC family protein [candidate division NPL-UPA2 bacterium Unc8]
MKFLIFCVVIFLGFPASAGTQETTRERVFTLEESIQLALKNNPQVLLAREELRRTTAMVMEARSGALPRLSAEAAYIRLDRLNMDSHRANLRLIQPLYAGGMIRGTIQAAELHHQAMEEGLHTVEAEITFRVKKGFYGILLAQELVAVRAEALNLLQSHYQTTKERFNKGEVPRFDLLRAEIEVINASSELIQVRSQLQSVENLFKNLLDLDLDSSFSLEGSLEYLPLQPDLNEALLKALEQRSEIRQLRLVSKMREKNIDVARSGHRPLISLFGNYEGLEGLPPTPDWDWNWNAGIMIEVPIFDGLMTRGRVGQARSEHEKSLLGLKDFKDRVRFEVRQAFLDLEKAREIIEFQLKNVQQAEENLKIVRERHRKGISTHLEVMGVHLALTKARTGYARALYEHLIGKASLERATGGRYRGSRE